MKDGFRQSMAWLHTWTGLVVAWVLFFVFVTGTAGYFTSEITHWMEPELPLHQPMPAESRDSLVTMALARLEKRAPKAQSWEITLLRYSQVTRGWQHFAIEWQALPQSGQERGANGSETLNPQTGKPLEKTAVRETGGGTLLYSMHYSLHYVDPLIGYWIVGVCTLLMLLAIITGTIIHRKIFKDFFTFRLGKGQRSWLDAHSTIAVMGLPFFLMITYSGFVILAPYYLPASVTALYGTNQGNISRFYQGSINRFYGDLYNTNGHHLAVSRPDASISAMLAKADATWGRNEIGTILIKQDEGESPRVVLTRSQINSLVWPGTDRLAFDAYTGGSLPPKAYNNTVLTRNALVGLHVAGFAGPWLRWLYFIAGLLGCAMVGTGMVLWTVKRRKQHEIPGRSSFAMRLVEALNAGTIVGLPAGIAAYFWVNRLLPLDITDRAAWEANFLFLVWGEAFLYAFFRDIRKAWVELLWLAAAAFGLLPLINFFTTNKHLGVTLPAGDWALAGFDLTMLALGAIFALMAIKVKRIWLKKAETEAASSATPTSAGAA